MIGHACKNEYNTYKDGQAGDQTKVEVYIRTWYNRPWNVVLRAKSQEVREKIAQAMEMACKNDNIGYSQNTRNTLWNDVKNHQFNPSCTTKAVNTDCSALVCVCCAYAGISTRYLQIGNNSLTTSTLRKYLLSSGEFDVITDKEYLTSDKYLVRGDILLYEGHHTAVNLDNGIYANQPIKLKSIDEIAHEVLEGKWGNGNETRRARLTEAGYNYALVRARVNEIYQAQQEAQKNIDNSIAYQTWKYLMSKINNAYGVAGLMGNIQAESGLNPKNLQNSCEKRLGMTDDKYVQAVDNGTYTNFVNDSCGFGLCQWTSSNRKLGLYNSRKNQSIGDLNVQLEWLYKELCTSYKNVLNGLKTAKSVREASDLVLTKFERPKDQSESVKIKRSEYGQYFYNKYNK